MKILFIVFVLASISAFSEITRADNHGFLLGDAGITCEKFLDAVDKDQSCTADERRTDADCRFAEALQTRAISFAWGFAAGLKAIGSKSEQEYTELVLQKMTLTNIWKFCANDKSALLYDYAKSAIN